MSIKGQGHSLTLVRGHSDFKVKCLTFGLYTQVSDSGPQGPLVPNLHRNVIETCISCLDFDDLNPIGMFIGALSNVYLGYISEPVGGL